MDRNLDMDAPTHQAARDPAGDTEQDGTAAPMLARPHEVVARQALLRPVAPVLPPKPDPHPRRDQPARLARRVEKPDHLVVKRAPVAAEERGKGL